MGRVYLLGGTSNAGKSTSASAIAALRGLECIEADGLRVQRQMLLPRTDALNYFADCRWLDQPPENSLDHKTEVARRTCADVLDEFVRSILSSERDVLLEGDDLLPDFVEGWLRAGAAGAAFLVETDPEVIRSRYRDRDRTCCLRGDPELLDRFIPHYLGWVRWLADEAHASGLALVDARGGQPMAPVASALGLASI